MRVPLIIVMSMMAGCLEAKTGAADASGTGQADGADDSGRGIDGGGEPDTSAATDGVDVAEPAPIFRITTNAEASTVPPQTRVNLAAEDLPEGAVSHRWTVTQPEGSVSVFMPSPFVPTPTFELNVAGTYVFALEVLDGQGYVMGTARYTMVAVPVSDLHVSLTWRTPRDSDESDTGMAVGSDLDLHFLRTDLGGTWFDTRHDTFWDAPGPGVVAGPARATLDRDDTDGGGPENVNLTPLTEGRYEIGVHYWDDHDFGPAFATVRVYFRGQLVEEWADVELAPRSLWRSHGVDANGTVTRLGGGAPEITPNFEHPQYFQP